MFFTNKHVVVALVVAPILAILAWFAVGEFFGERPHSAELGKSYSLVEQSNCRYQSGQCELENQDFKLSLTMVGMDLVLNSAHTLEGVMIRVGDPAHGTSPEKMQAIAGDGMNWRYSLEALPETSDRIRLVALTRYNAYFADASTDFIRQ